MGFEGRGLNPAQDRWRHLVNTAMKLEFHNRQRVYRLGDALSCSRGVKDISRAVE